MADKKKQKRCYIYTRVSSQSQVDGYSLDAQRDRLMQKAASENMAVVAEFSDEGKSGKNITGRPQFMAMLDRIQHGNPDKVNYVMVFKLSRFGRNTADVLNSLQAMQKRGVELIAAEDGIDSSKDAGKLMVSVLAAVAEIERDNIRIQSKAGQLQKAKEGGWNGGPAPLGYRIVQDANGRNSRLAVDEDEAKLIRLIFDKYAHTKMGYSGVAKWLNRNGYRRPVPVNGKYSSFTDRGVKNILDNPVYTGKIVYGRFGLEKVQDDEDEYRHVIRSQYDSYDGLHEAIISDELWEEVQAKRRATAGKQQEHYGPIHVHVLSGIVRCPVCGMPMCGNVAKLKQKGPDGVPLTKLYYHCKHGRHSTGRTCTYNRGIREDILDKQVVKVVQQAVNNMYFEKSLVTAFSRSEDLDELAANLDKLQTEKKAIEKKKSRLLDRIERLDEDSGQYDATFNDLQDVLRRHNQSIAELDDQIEETSVRLQTARAGAASFEDTLRMFHQSMGSIENWPAGHLRAFMHNFLEHVEVYPQPLPNGRQVKSIRFKFPVSVDGGKTYGETVDLDSGDDDETDPPSGGGGTPDPGNAPSGGGVFLTEDILPNPYISTAIHHALRPVTAI